MKPKPLTRTPDLAPLFELAIEEARRLGFTGTLHVDAAGTSLQFQAVGPMVIPPPVLERLEGKTLPQQRAIVAGVVSRFLRATAPPLAACYDGLEDREARLRLERNVFAIGAQPERPLAWTAVARVERALGVDGWQQRFRRAADLYTAQAARLDAKGQHVGGDLLAAANMYRLAGLPTESRRAAEMALEHLERTSPPFELRHRCAALALAGRRAELAADAARRGRDALDQEWWSFGLAAAAAERGDREALRGELEAAERRAVDDEIDWYSVTPSSGDQADLLRDWLRELESTG